MLLIANELCSGDNRNEPIDGPYPCGERDLYKSRINSPEEEERTA